MKRSALVALGVVVFLASALLAAPADRLYAWFAPKLAESGVQAQGLAGTLSSGRAMQLDVMGNPVIRDLGWKLQKLHLLLGRASFKLDGGRDGVLLDGTASLVPSGTLTLSNFRLNSPLAGALASAGYPFMPVDGQLGLDVSHLKLRQGWPDKAQGTLTVRGLGWKLGREPVLFGDYEALIENETAGVKVILRSLAGALEVSGEARAGNDRKYEMHLQMRPRPNAPPMVTNLVRNLGQPDAQGWYHLRRQGTTAATPPAS